MALPITEAQHFATVGAYNLDIWPAHAALYVLAAVVVFYAARGRRAANLGMAALWVWTGGIYFMRALGPMTPLGHVLGGLFMLQALLLLKVEFNLQRGALSSLGVALIVYAVAVYPLVAIYLGRDWPWFETLGLPAPTLMFTLGLLLRAGEEVPAYAVVLPLLLSLAGAAQGLALGSYEDLGLLAAAAGSLGLFGRKRPSPLERLEALGE